MKLQAHLLKKGQKGTIATVDVELIPLKLLEMGCLPGNSFEILHFAPLGDPIYVNINEGSHVAIRKDIAATIEIELEKP